jgi:putative phosphoesterase
MKNIGLLSDTHGFFHPRIPEFFTGCDEIWHAGDIGNMEVVNRLEAIATLRAVYGNIDGQTLRKDFPEVAFFTVEGLKVLMMHIGGYPGRYTSQARGLIIKYRPGLFISGHSHILKVVPDNKYGLLHINPGAAGHSGFHRSITLVRFNIDKGRAKDLEILDIDRHRKI